MKMYLPLNMVFFQLMKMKILLIINNGVFSPFFQLVILVFWGGGYPQKFSSWVQVSSLKESPEYSSYTADVQVMDGKRCDLGV